MIRKAVVVTCQAPPNAPATFRHGVYQRFGALLRATADVFPHVNLLAVFRTESGAVPVTQKELETYYQRFFDVSVNVTKIVIPPADAGPVGRWETVKRGLCDPLNFGSRDRLRHLTSLDTARHLLWSKPDVILVHRLSGFATLEQIGNYAGPVLIDLDDLEHRVALRMLRFPPHYPGKVLQLFRMVGLARLERAASRRSAVTFVCSERDKRWMERILGAARVMVLPNAVEARSEMIPAPSSGNVLFVGTLNYLPNSEAVRWFSSEIWPRVLRDCPDATFTVAGRCPEQVPGSGNPHSSIRFLGFVPDLDSLYRNAQMVVCPIQAGGGTRIKIIEAAMYGRPVISTKIGAEGLDFRHPGEIRIKEDAVTFAAECVRLLKNLPECRSIGSAAFKRAGLLYSRDAFIQQAEAVIQTAARV